MSLADAAWVRLSRPGSFFCDGWGDDRLIAATMAAFASPPAAPGALADASWTSEGPARDVTWSSPVAHALPEASRTARARVLEPRRVRGTVVLLASTGDVGYARRSRLGAPLVEDGVRVVMLENPFYGPRRPPTQRDVEVRTVAELAVMGWGAAEEGRQLAACFAADGPVVVAGYSMGGQMAAIAAARATFPLGVVAAAAPVSARTVFVDGVLSRVTAWDALGHDRKRLVGILDGPSLLRAARPRGPAVVLGGTHDRYVPPHAVARLAHHWDVPVRWMRGGHVTGFVLGQRALRRAMLDALGR